MDGSVKAGLAGCTGSLVIVGLFMLLSHSAASAPGATQAASPEAAAFHLDFGEQLAASNCNGIGAPVVNVTQKISNDADSGVAGNYWGLDSFNRTIQVWQVSDGQYCALVRYEGRFAGIAGQRSPGDTGVLTGGESGTVIGGYKALIGGTLLPSPAWRQKGSLGSFDYQCDVSGSCPGAVSWPDQYFTPGYTFDQPWWGWIYRAGANRVWVNASSGNQGDII